MRPSLLLDQHRDRIRAIILAQRVTNPRVFGSTVRCEDREGSDLDVLVDPLPQASILDIGLIQMELSEFLGIPVDVLTPKAIHASFRDEVLAEARPI